MVFCHRQVFSSRFFLRWLFIGLLITTTSAVLFGLRREDLHLSWCCTLLVPWCITQQLPGKMKERLLNVVINLGWDFIILQVLLSMKTKLFCFHLMILHINFVSTYHNWDVRTNTIKIHIKIHQETIKIHDKKNITKLTGKDHDAMWEHSCKSTLQLHQTWWCHIDHECWTSFK